MHIVPIAWMFVVVLMAAAEATAPDGTLLGAFFTLLLYGVLPLSIVMYVLGTPVRRQARWRAEQALAAEAAAPHTAADATADATASAAADTAADTAPDRAADTRATPATPADATPPGASAAPDDGRMAAGDPIAPVRKEA